MPLSHISISFWINVQIFPSFEDSSHSVFSQSHLWSSHHEIISFPSNILSVFPLMAQLFMLLSKWLGRTVSSLGTRTQARWWGWKVRGRHHTLTRQYSLFAGHLLGSWCTFSKLQLLHSFWKEKTWKPKSSRSLLGHFINKLKIPYLKTNLLTPRPEMFTWLLFVCLF